MIWGWNLCVRLSMHLDFYFTNDNRGVLRLFSQVARLNLIIFDFISGSCLIFNIDTKKVLNILFVPGAGVTLD